MARALFFLGRGPDATALGSVYLETRAEHTNAEPTPDVVATLPIGRDVLTATNPDDYEHRVGDLLTAWRAGGFGDACTRYQEHLANDESPHLDGTFPGDTASPMPYAPSFRLAYAYDQGQVWLWRAGAWNIVTVTDPADAADAADGRPLVEVTPAALPLRRELRRHRHAGPPAARGVDHGRAHCAGRRWNQRPAGARPLLRGGQPRPPRDRPVGVRADRRRSPRAPRHARVPRDNPLRATDHRRPQLDQPRCS